MDLKRGEEGDKLIWTILNVVPLILSTPNDLCAIVQFSVHHLITHDYFPYCNHHQSLNSFLPAMSVPSQLAIHCFEKGKKKKKDAGLCDTFPW